MKYALLHYEPDSEFSARDDASRTDYWPAWMTYVGALEAAKVMVGGNPLQPPAMATSVRVRDGQRTVQDGPFADTHERLGGYVVLELPDLDAALDWAAKCPAALHGCVEVRPVIETSED